MDMQEVEKSEFSAFKDHGSGLFISVGSPSFWPSWDGLPLSRPWNS